MAKGVRRQSKAEKGRRLTVARLARGFGTARVACARLGLSSTLYAAHEKGERPITRQDVALYAAVLDVNPDWIETGVLPSWLGADFDRDMDRIVAGEVSIAGIRMRVAERDLPVLGEDEEESDGRRRVARCRPVPMSCR